MPILYQNPSSTLIRVEKTGDLLIIFLTVDIMRVTKGALQMEKYDFGNKLYEYRTQKGLTQKELGKLLGVTDKAVSKWETGESKPRLDKMTQITELFDTSIDRMLGSEAQDGGEQLKPYKTIFDSTLKKYDKYYKTARIWTYIFAGVYFVFSLIQKVGTLLSGTIALNTVSSLIEITVLTAAVLIFTLKFKPKFGECENKDMNIFAVFLFLLYCAIGTFLVVSAVQTGKLTGEISEDNEVSIILFCIQAIVLAIILIISVIKKKYTVFAIVVGGFSAYSVLFDNSLFGLVICAATFQFACYIEKRHWLILAQKADIEIEKTNGSQKVANIFTAIIAVITLLSIIMSSFSPYIIYKICLKKYGPTHLYNEVIDFDYSAEFTGDFTEIKLGKAKLKIPNGFEKFGEADENEEFISFKNEQKGFIMVSFYSEEDGGILFDESDPEEFEYYHYEKWLNSICQKYYGVPYSTIYGGIYLNYFLDLEDIKFYESEKAVFLCAELVSKMVMDTGNPMSVSKFDNGMFSGLISGRLMTYGDKSNVYWTADIWRSNDLDGPYYTVTYMAKNTSDIKDSQMICQIVNSFEF